MQVADALRTEIASGALGAGDKLPSVRNLAERFKVAPMTAQSAIDTLKSEGLVYTSPGRGTFVRAEPPTSSSDAPSAEFIAITEHLTELDAQVQSMTGRLAELEKLVRHDRQASS